MLTTARPFGPNRDPNMAQNRDACAICCQLELDCAVISGRNVKTIVRYVVINFEVACSNSFRDIQFFCKRSNFVTAAKADIDDSIMRKGIRASLKNTVVPRKNRPPNCTTESCAL